MNVLISQPPFLNSHITLTLQTEQRKGYLWEPKIASIRRYARRHV